MSTETTPPRPVLDAFAAARAISDASYDGRDAVLDSADYADVMAAARSAIAANRRPSLSLAYETLVLEATYSSHGARLVPGQTIASPDGVATTVVVAIRAEHPVLEAGLAPVASSVADDLDELIGDLGVHIADRVFVVLQPGAEPAAPMVDALGTPVAVGDAVAVATYDPEVRAVTIERTVVSSIRADLGQWIEVTLDGRTEVIESSEIVRLG